MDQIHRGSQIWIRFSEFVFSDELYHLKAVFQLEAVERATLAALSNGAQSESRRPPSTTPEAYEAVRGVRSWFPAGRCLQESGGAGGLGRHLYSTIRTTNATGL